MKVSFHAEYRDQIALNVRHAAGAMVIPKRAFDSDKARDWFLVILPGEGGNLATRIMEFIYTSGI
jgi:hypothetical protein